MFQDVARFGHGQKPATYSRQRFLPWRARYDAYGVGLVFFVLFQAVERRLGDPLWDGREEQVVAPGMLRSSFLYPD